MAFRLGKYPVRQIVTLIIDNMLMFFLFQDQRQKKLEDLLPLLTSDGHQEMRPPPIVRPTSSRDLCERFKKAMELVHANMAFSAKA